MTDNSSFMSMDAYMLAIKARATTTSVSAMMDRGLEDSRKSGFLAPPRCPLGYMQQMRSHMNSRGERLNELQEIIRKTKKERGLALESLTQAGEEAAESLDEKSRSRRCARGKCGK